MDLHIEVDEGMTVREGHDISEKVKRRLIEEGPEVLDVVVHLFKPQERERYNLEKLWFEAEVTEIKDEEEERHDQY